MVFVGVFELAAGKGASDCADEAVAGLVTAKSTRCTARKGAHQAPVALLARLRGVGVTRSRVLVVGALLGELLIWPGRVSVALLSILLRLLLLLFVALVVLRSAVLLALLGRVLLAAILVVVGIAALSVLESTLAWRSVGALARLWLIASLRLLAVRLWRIALLPLLGRRIVAAAAGIVVVVRVRHVDGQGWQSGHSRSMKEER